MKPEVVEIFERRVLYHKMICDLLENHMIDVIEQVKEAPKIIEEDQEEEKKQPEEEKEEDKTLYDIDFVYRTIERRLKQNPEKYVAASFGFKDKTG